MKSIITLLLLLPFICYSQDYIQLTNGDQFNCKIVSVSKSEVVILKDSTTRKIPYYLVSKFGYNTTLDKETTTKVDSTTKGTPYVFDTENGAEQEVPKIDFGLDGANSWYTLSMISGIATIGLAIGNMAMTEPTLSPNDVSNADKVKQYYKDIDEYNSAKQILTNTIYITGAVGILSAAFGGLKTIQYLEKKNNRLSLNQNGLGIGLCYKF